MNTLCTISTVVRGVLVGILCVSYGVGESGPCLGTLRAHDQVAPVSSESKEDDAASVAAQLSPRSISIRGSFSSRMITQISSMSLESTDDDSSSLEDIKKHHAVQRMTTDIVEREEHLRKKGLWRTWRRDPLYHQPRNQKIMKIMEKNRAVIAHYVEKSNKNGKG